MVKLDAITDQEWQEVNEFNRFIWNDFLTNSTELSPDTLKAYHSNLRIWFIWVKNNLANKKQTDIKPLEFKRFQNWMMNRECSSSDMYNKRSAISSLNNYIETYYLEDYPMFRSFINKSIKRPPKAFVHEKEPLTKDEFSKLITTLEEKNEWQKIAYLRFTLDTGCRRGESRQVLKNIVNSVANIKEKKITNEDGVEETKIMTIYQTPPIRCKGSGKLGKIRKLSFSQETMDSFNKWLEVRKEDDCEFMFVVRYGGVMKQVSINTFNTWSKNTFEAIVGRRFHPHLIRESRATQLVVEEGKDIKIAQRLLGHNSSETTEIYVIRDESEDLDELYMD